MLILILYILLLMQIFIFALFFIKSEKQRKSFFNQLSLNKIKFHNVENIDVIIAAKEKYERISLCISNVYKSGFKNIYICIDEKNQETLNQLKENFPELNIIENNTHLGKIKSQQKCLEQSQNDNVLVLDADINLKSKEIQDFVNYFYESKCDFLCPYSNGKSENENSLLFGIAESDRYLRQRIIRAGRDFFEVSNLSGYCMLAKKDKYLDIIDSDTIQDDVIATINLLNKGYIVKTFHKSVCEEEERNKLIPYLFQKTRWTAGNLVLLSSYQKLFKSTSFIKAFAFSSSFLLWYFSLWVDCLCFCTGIFHLELFIPVFLEFLIKYICLLKISDFKLFRIFNLFYVIIWPLFTTICLILSPLYLVGLVDENKTRR